MFLNFKKLFVFTLFPQNTLGILKFYLKFIFTQLSITENQKSVDEHQLVSICGIINFVALPSHKVSGNWLNIASRITMYYQTPDNVCTYVNTGSWVIQSIFLVWGILFVSHSAIVNCLGCLTVFSRDTVDNDNIEIHISCKLLSCLVKTGKIAPLQQTIFLHLAHHNLSFQGG